LWGCFFLFLRIGWKGEKGIYKSSLGKGERGRGEILGWVGE